MDVNKEEMPQNSTDKSMLLFFHQGRQSSHRIQNGIRIQGHMHRVPDIDLVSTITHQIRSFDYTRSHTRLEQLEMPCLMLFCINLRRVFPGKNRCNGVSEQLVSLIIPSRSQSILSILILLIILQVPVATPHPFQQAFRNLVPLDEQRVITVFDIGCIHHGKDAVYILLATAYLGRIKDGQHNRAHGHPHQTDTRSIR